MGSRIEETDDNEYLERAGIRISRLINEVYIEGRETELSNIEYKPESVKLIFSKARKSPYLQCLSYVFV